MKYHYTLLGKHSSDKHIFGKLLETIRLQYSSLVNIISYFPPLGFSLKNQHLTLVERFVCPNEPGGGVVWNLVFLVGSPMANWSQARGQTKIGSKDLMKDDTQSEDTRPGGSSGSPSGARPKRRTRR